MLHEPSVILLDEPYTGLDANAVETLNTMLDEAHGRGRTIILTTHDLEHGLRAATRAAIIDRGKIVFDGAGDDSGIRHAYAEYVRRGAAK
jgi:ABC-type multidrug transport system ATPase subunit